MYDRDTLLAWFLATNLREAFDGLVREFDSIPLSEHMKEYSRARFHDRVRPKRRRSASVRALAGPPKSSRDQIDEDQERDRV